MSAPPLPPRPLSIGAAATLACLWEVTAPKPGNVYRGADFEDLSYVDFLASAAVTGPVLEAAAARGVGATVLAGVEASRLVAGSNVNLGILLLPAPLAAIPPHCTLRQGLADVLGALTQEDARLAYAAIRLAKPGGLGSVAGADVNEMTDPGMTLLEAMRLASNRDLIAKQFANNFAEVFSTADRIAAVLTRGLPLSDAIVTAYLELLCNHPDSLVARKCGPEVADKVSKGAAAVLDAERHGPESLAAAVADFDFWLRADGHRRNPGTSADVIAAALFVLLREERVKFPVSFYTIHDNDT